MFEDVELRRYGKVRKLFIKKALSFFFLCVFFFFSSFFIVEGVIAQEGQEFLEPEIILEKKVDIEDINFNISCLLNNKGVHLFETYFQWNIPFGRFTLGKKQQAVGPGYFSQLVLSCEGPSLYHIALESKHKWLRMEFEGFQMIAFLEREIKRQLFVHRLSTKSFIPGLKLGASEAMMVSEIIHPLYYLPLPWPYYLSTKLIGMDSIYNNHTDHYIGLDFAYTFHNRARIYGEILVDEYPFRWWHLNPDKRAHIFGIYYPAGDDLELRAEYSNVFNYMYIHRYPQNNYLYNGEPLGHWLGPDGDVLDVEVTKIVDKDSTMKLGLRYVRKGPGNFAEDYNTAEDYYATKFLSSIVERRAFIRLEYETRLSSWFSTEFQVKTGRIWDEVGNTGEDVLHMGMSFNLSL